MPNQLCHGGIHLTARNAAPEVTCNAHLTSRYQRARKEFRLHELQEPQEGVGLVLHGTASAGAQPYPPLGLPSDILWSDGETISVTDNEML